MKKDETLKAVVARATNTQAEVLKVMGEIWQTDRGVFDEIVHVAMTPGATFVKGSRTVDFLGGHTVLSQSMYDSGTGRLRHGYKELVAGCIERDSNGWKLVEAEDIVIHDLDEPPAPDAP